MLPAESEVRAARARRPLRRPLALQVRQEQQAAAAGAAPPPPPGPAPGPAGRGRRRRRATPARSRRCSSRRRRSSARGRGRSRTAARARSIAGVAEAARTAPLVPIEQATVPGRIAPRPRFASGPSAPPAMTGVPAGRPMPAAARRVTCVVSTSAGSRSGERPASSSASGSQSPVSRFRSPVPEAVPWSMSQSPVSACITSSLTPTQRRTLANVSGCSSRHQISLQSGDIGCTGVPVRRCRSVPRRRRACASARWSAHVMSGVSATPASPSPTRLCIAPDSATPATGRSAAATACATASHAAGADPGGVLRRRGAPRGHHRAVALHGERLRAGRADVEPDDDVRVLGNPNPPVHVRPRGTRPPRDSDSVPMLTRPTGI